MSDLQQIKALLQGRVLDLVQELAPYGHRAGQYWIALNPTRADDSAGSFWVRVAGSGIGVWADEATGDGAAQAPNGAHKGDILGFVQYAARLADVKETLRWSRDFLQLGQMPEADRVRRAAAVTQRVKEADDNDEARLARHRKRAFGLYVEAKKRPFLGSPAHQYLAGRSIDIAQLGRMPGVLGWLPPWEGRDGRFTHASMLAGFQNDAGDTVAVHRTFIAERNGTWGKAAVEHVRKIWPAYGGCAIRLWQGGSKMSIKEAAACGLREPLVLVEGVEDGLSVALALPEFRVWCAGALGNVAALTLPECVDEVILCADNDWGKPQAQRLLDAGIAALSAQGRKVRVARSHVGKDVNDALRS